MHSHFSALFWSRLLSDEAPVWSRLRFKLHIRSCKACAAEWESAQHERAQFLSADASDLLSTLQKRAPRQSTAARPPRENRAPWRLSMVAAAASIAVLVVITRPAPETLRAKGSDVFVLHALRQGKQSMLGEYCAPGTVLRAQYRTAKPYLMIVGIDSTSEVQLLFPATGKASQKLDASEGLIDAGWEIDDRPGVERFIAFFSDTAISFSVAKSAVLANKGTLLKEASVIEVKCRKP